MSRTLVAVLLGLGLALAAQPSAAQQAARTDQMCADCHGAPALERLSARTHADTIACLTCHHIGFSNDPRVIRQRRLETCVGCHDEVADHHVGVRGDVPDCTTCHSIHGHASVAEAKADMSVRCASCHESPHPAHAPAAPDPPQCADCHVTHTGRAFQPADSVMVASCASCHAPVHASHAEVPEIQACLECHSVREPEARDLMADSESCATCHQEDLHPAHASVENQPLCLECHSFATDPPMPQAGAAMAQRCGTCHEEALHLLRTGGHGALFGGEGAEDHPSCFACHTAHMNDAEAKRTLLVTSAIACMECHGESSLTVKYGLPFLVRKSYADDFHGATLRFLQAAGGEMGDNPIMICSDCHGVHDVSTLTQDDVAEVCLRCHTSGDVKLAGAWLGHEAPSITNRPLIWLVRLFYYFLIPFMLLGLTVIIIFQLMDQRRKGARVMKTEGVRRIRAFLKGERLPPQETVERFTRTERFEHAASAFVFIALVVTGLPQTRPDLDVAQWIINALGGIWSTRVIHRWLGVLFILLMVTHVTRAIMKAIKLHRFPIMVPTMKDFDDVVQTFRHYIFREPMPRVGKFDFAEKFEYWGLFLGGIVMSSTGLVLMFPELVTQLVPGVVVAAARLMHGLEATFAVMVVILWHSYGVILRPEVFPLDTSIFTGKMSVERLAHEHPLEYERLFPDRPPPGHGDGHGHGEGHDHGDSPEHGHGASPRPPGEGTS